MNSSTAVRRCTAIAAALALAALGLTGCGKEEAPRGSDGSSSSQSGSGSTTSAPRDSGASTPPSGSGGSGGGSASGNDGEPLPDDWPEQFLVPSGTITLVMERPNGYMVLIEGVDSDEAKDLVDRMVASGLTSDGFADLGRGEWTTMITGSGYFSTYGYENGGAGEPKLTIMLAQQS